MEEFVGARDVRYTQYTENISIEVNIGIGMTVSVKSLYRNLRYTVIFWYTEIYNMAKSSILLYYNTKTGFLIIPNELNLAEIPSKQL